MTLHFHFDIGRVLKHIGGESQQPSFTSNATPASVEAKACEILACGYCSAEMVQNGLVSDLSRQADILGRDATRPKGSSARDANERAFRRYA